MPAKTKFILSDGWKIFGDPSWEKEAPWVLSFKIEVFWVWFVFCFVLFYWLFACGKKKYMYVPIAVFFKSCQLSSHHFIFRHLLRTSAYIAALYHLVNVTFLHTKSSLGKFHQFPLLEQVIETPKNWAKIAHSPVAANTNSRADIISYSMILSNKERFGCLWSWCCYFLCDV